MTETVNLGKAKYFIILLVYAVLLFIPFNAAKRLWRTDEPRVAGISANMQISGDYALPKLNGKLFFEYPPMYYWLTSSFYTVFGRSPFSSKLTSALAAIISVMITYLFVLKIEYDILTAFLAGVISGTSAQIWSSAYTCTVDMTLCMFIMCSIYAFYCLHISYKYKTGSFLYNLGFFILFSAALSGGILTKNLVGLAIPSCALFFWMISEWIWDKKFYLKSWIALFGCSLLSLIPAALWVWCLYIKHGSHMAYVATWKNTLGRFLGTYEQHANPFYYYFPKLPLKFLPWTVLLVTIIIIVIKHKALFKFNSSIRLFICWFLFPLILLCLSSGKRPIYLLPLYPAAALFTAVEAMNIIKENYYLSRFNWKKIIFYFSGLLLIIFSIVALVAVIFFNNKNSYYPLFKYYKNIKAADKKLYLYTPNETLQGAVNYYLNIESPIFGEKQESKAVNLLNSNKNAYIIARLRHFGDKDLVLKAFKIKGKYYCIYHKKN